MQDETFRRPGVSRQAGASCAVAGVVLLVLAGCAGARVSDITASSAAGAPPSEILVAVDVAGPGDAANDKTAQQAAGALQAALVRRLTEARVTAEAFVPGSSHPDAAVLHVSVVAADPGSAVGRFVVGFGVGKSELATKTDLARGDTTNGTSITAFSTASDSGFTPGLGLPGVIGLVTGSAVRFGIGAGIDSALNLRGGMDKRIARTAAAIVKQLKSYYASVGWKWEVAQKS